MQEKNNNIVKLKLQRAELLQKQINLYQTIIDFQNEKIGIAANKDEIYQDIKQKNYELWYKQLRPLCITFNVSCWVLIHLLISLEFVPVELITLIVLGALCTEGIITTCYHFNNLYEKYTLNHAVKQVNIPLANTIVKSYENQIKEAQIDLYELNQTIYQPDINQEKTFDNGLTARNIDLEAKVKTKK